MAADDTALPSAADAPASPAGGPQDPALLDRWVDRVAALLELPVHEVDVSLVLDLARDAAHGVARPAAPLTTFLLGLAVGRAGGGVDDARRLAADIAAEIAHLRDPVGPLDADGRSRGGPDLLRADGRRPPARTDVGGRA
ncbi:hypothetical protein BFL36_11225 [Clavibacter michiganensis]|uniref:DUF6457 domain-containing protein n=1 Tax=Clavibacter michiganensis TaxID=28447 RepID=A0A251Y9Q6_9MICO|nr:DUF6457 domain-containing protein [Clavibacter michiganensis]OUE20987.1 hypothetical protein BFL36_11225 [Clavibacter michiganensis]